MFVCVAGVGASCLFTQTENHFDFNELKKEKYLKVQHQSGAINNHLNHCKQCLITLNINLPIIKPSAKPQELISIYWLLRHQLQQSAQTTKLNVQTDNGRW